MTTRSLLLSAAAALVAGALVSTGAFAATAPVGKNDVVKVSSAKAAKSMQLAQNDNGKKKKSKSKSKKKKGKGKKKKQD